MTFFSKFFSKKGNSTSSSSTTSPSSSTPAAQRAPAPSPSSARVFTSPPMPGMGGGPFQEIQQLLEKCCVILDAALTGEFVAIAEIFTLMKACYMVHYRVNPELNVGEHDPRSDWKNSKPFGRACDEVFEYKLADGTTVKSALMSRSHWNDEQSAEVRPHLIRLLNCCQQAVKQQTQANARGV